MLHRTAAGDHCGSHRLGGMVRARFGEPGIAELMGTWAEEIVQHAPASVRNVYGRVQAERALTVVIDRIRSDWVGESPLEPATAEEHQRNINAYLVAIQRQDDDAVNQHVRTIGDGHPTDFPSCTTPSG
jgi:hypothetical protein